MAWPLEWLLVATAFLGHFSLAVWLYNRLHAVAWPRVVIKTLDKSLVLAAAGVLVLFAWQWWETGEPPIFHWRWFGYAGLCWVAALIAVPCWAIPKLLERTPDLLASNDTHVLDIQKRLGFTPLHGFENRLWSRLPGNQILQVAVQEKTLRLPDLPRGLDGLRIAHLSDLHMTGRLGREFYDLVVDETNAWEPDLIAITGDILEKAACLPWISQTLGRLRARHGKFFILGNHELRLPDVGPLRAALAECGFVDLGSRCEQIFIDGQSVLLAGNELPWFGTLPILPGSEFRIQNSESRAFRILLSHSPDQFSWAKANHFNLMLAGHNHGGQIRLPYVGALIAPSWYGTRYAGGLYLEPPTLLHVSRGLASVQPVRLNCPPELALLILTA